MSTLFHQFWFKPLLAVLGLLLLLLLLPPLFGVKAVFLWTDRLIFVLVAGILMLIAYVRTREHLRQPWLQVFRQRRAMIALVVLCSFVIVGLLDSVHYRKPLATADAEAQVHFSVEVYSLLDRLLIHLREHEEKSYSAPFATHLHAKESVTLPNGQQVRIYPRLLYGGAHLDDPDSQIGPDLLLKTGIGTLLGLVLSLCVSFGFILLLSIRRNTNVAAMVRLVRRGQTDIPWRAVLLSTTLLIVLVTTVLLLSGSYHVLGTDKVGTDVLYLAVKSIRTGLVIGTLTTLVMLPFAILLGIMAGYFRGWVDDVIQYLYTTLSSIPGVLLIAAAILSIQVYIANHPELFETAIDRADLRLLALCVILGITSWTGLCRLLRAETLKLREMDYIQAATAFGVGNFTILGRHVLPNVLHIVLIIVVLDFSGLVLAEAVLSYVGVGVDPSTVSWGNMINGARLELAREPVVWWSLIAAFVFMFTLVLAANLFADAVRDAFDPRIREQGV
ncbi:MAG: ABC transporter permease [Halobacteria archaeon]|nr:ABC transporter permease [Halobacteria archaeon]